MSQLDSLRTTVDQKLKQARTEALKEAERHATESASTLEQKLRMESEAMKNACSKELERADQKIQALQTERNVIEVKLIQAQEMLQSSER